MKNKTVAILLIIGILSGMIILASCKDAKTGAGGILDGDESKTPVDTELTEDDVTPPEDEDGNEPPVAENLDDIDPDNENGESGEKASNATEPVDTTESEDGNGVAVSGAAQPSIIVHTEFSAGEVASNAVDIEYTATPGAGASVSEVWYSINGGAPEYIYLAGSSTVTAKGELGAARVLLIPGDNSIVFTMLDTDGNTAEFTVDAKPSSNFVLEAPPERDPKFWTESEKDSGRSYMSNRIGIFAETGVTEAEVAEAVKLIGGEIIGRISLVDFYYIQVAESTEDELEEMCKKLLEAYPDILMSASLDISEASAD